MIENFNSSIDTLVEIRGAKYKYPLEAAEADVIVCTDRLRMTLLGLTTIYPGLCTLFANLWQSSDNGDLLEPLTVRADDIDVGTQHAQYNGAAKTEEKARGMGRGSQRQSECSEPWASKGGRSYLVHSDAHYDQAIT